jgi:hypothetical protein
MGQAGKWIARAGFEAVLAVFSLAGFATATGCPDYGVPPECSTNADCEAHRGNGWYCDYQQKCWPPVDAGK